MLKFSIITATYNSEHGILSCLESVSSQTYSNIEHLIKDGGSEDNTLGRVKNYSEKHKQTQYVVLSESDKGIYDALNTGIGKATGDIIGFVHSDDILANQNIVQKIADQFKESNVDGVFGDLHYVDKEDTDKVIRNWKSKPFQRKNLKYGWMPAHPTLFLKKEVYEKHGRFDSTLKIAADYDFMLRVLQDDSLNFDYLPVVICKMRVGGASNKNLANIITKSKEDLLAIRRNKVGGFFTLICKNVRKVGQFLKK